MNIKKVNNHTFVYAHPNYIKDKDSLFDRDHVTQKQYAKWLDRKLHLLESHGYTLLGLGKRVLRTETAATVAASLVLGTMGAL